MFEHDTKRATQPIFVNLARVSECQDRRKTAPSAALKKAAPFSVACGAIFHNLLKQQKIAPGLDTESARDTMMNRLCCSIKQFLPLFDSLARWYGQTGSARAN